MRILAALLQVLVRGILNIAGEALAIAVFFGIIFPLTAVPFWMEFYREHIGYLFGFYGILVLYCCVGSVIVRTVELLREKKRA